MKLDPNTTALLDQMGFDAAMIEAMLLGGALLSVLAIVTAIPTVMIAKRKGRSPALWLLFALSVPVLPLLLVWLLPIVPIVSKVPGAGRPPEQ